MADRPTRSRILATPDYRAGSLPPEGYLQWHAWADVQREAGIKQVECPTCGLWQTPQELSAHKVAWTVKDRMGRHLEQSAFQCAKCAGKVGAAHVES